AAAISRGRFTPDQSTPATWWVTSRAGLRLTARIIGAAASGHAPWIIQPAARPPDGRLAALSSSPIGTTMGSSSALRSIPPTAARDAIDPPDTPYPAASMT